MLEALYVDILRQEGFEIIGQLDYRLQISVWWNRSPDKLIQILVANVGESALIKADKSYYLQSISDQGETWARDIGLLHDYLENHFPELRLSLAHFRDVPPALAKAEVVRRMAVDAPTQPIPSVEQIAELQRQLRVKQREVNSAETLLSLSSTGSDLLSGYVHQQTRSRRGEVAQLQTKVESHQRRIELFQHLQREYERKGSAAVYCFTICSNQQVANTPAHFRDALRSVVNELTDQHRFQVTQKLQGGRLNIQVAEAEEPALIWIEQWLGGALSPMQMRTISPEFEHLKRASAEHVVVTPDEPIVAGDSVRHHEKHLAARFLSTVLHRLDKTDGGGEKNAYDTQAISPDDMPMQFGHRIDDAGQVIGPAIFALSDVIHTYISGTTGSGKSFLARVLVEEASLHGGLSVLVLDPRNQFVGLLVPEDRPQILQRYPEFGMDVRDAKGFAFDYFAPGLPFVAFLPSELSVLASGRSIVSFKGLDDRRRCALAGRILNAVFETLSAAESDRPRCLLVVDEAQLFTQKRVDDTAKDVAAATERALDMIAREGRKYGLLIAIVTQTIRDFSYQLASIRQMTTTKAFLRNSDREVEYADDFVGDGRKLIQLPTGTALVHNSNWGVATVRIRPPYSKVFELKESEIRQLVGHPKVAGAALRSEAQRLLAVIQEHGSPPRRPLNMSQLADLAGISSKRRLLKLISELEKATTIKTRRLPGRGTPRVIELVSHSIETCNTD